MANKFDNALQSIATEGVGSKTLGKILTGTVSTDDLPWRLRLSADRRFQLEVQGYRRCSVHVLLHDLRYGAG